MARCINWQPPTPVWWLPMVPALLCLTGRTLLDRNGNKIGAGEDANGNILGATWTP